jgi:hypothetical protein
MSGIMGVQYPDYFAHSIFMEDGLPLDISRNVVVSNGLQRNVSHIVFLDADIILKTDTFLRLKEANFPIISALYFGRNPPHNAVANINLARLDELKLCKGISTDIELDVKFNLNIPVDITNLEELIMVTKYSF